MKRTHQGVAGAVFAAVAIATVGVPGAQAGQASGSERASAAKAKKVNSRIVRRFHVLHRRGRARLADGVTPPPWPAKIGVVSTAARTVQTKNGVAVTVYPGAGGACLLVTSDPDPARTTTMGAGCATTSDLLAGKGWTYSWPGGGSGTLVGLVPDNVTAALVTRADGTTQRVPVIDNVWSINGAATQNTDTSDGPAKMPFSKIQVQDKSGTYTTAFAR